jgi:AraC-like DNA-binding protein
MLAEHGVPLADVLDGTGIVPEDLRYGGFVPYVAGVAALERAALLTGRDDFGLRLGLRQTLSALGPVGKVMRHSATLGEALRLFVRLQIGNSTGAASYLQKMSGAMAFGYYAYRVSGKPSKQLHDLVIAAGVRFITELSHGKAKIEEIHTIRPRPASLQVYQSLGSAPILFGQSQTCVVLSDAAMSLPLPEASPEKTESGLINIQSLINRAPIGIEGRVRHMVGPMLQLEKHALANIARHLEMQPRTLQRLLREEGTTFEAIRDDVRYSAARDLLAMTQLPVLEIALSLGFSTPSAFIRAFERWSGTTPARWRSQAKDEAGPP